MQYSIVELTMNLYDINVLYGIVFPSFIFVMLRSTRSECARVLSSLFPSSTSTDFWTLSLTALGLQTARFLGSAPRISP